LKTFHRFPMPAKVPAPVVPLPKFTAPREAVGELLLPLYSTTSRKALTIVAPAGGAQAMVTRLPLLTVLEVPEQKRTETPEAP